MQPPYCPDCRQARPWNRRELLRLGSLSLFGLTLPELLGAHVTAEETDSAFGRAKACILLFMWGGPAHQDTWDMKPEAPAEIRGEFQPIATNVPGIQVCEHFPELAKRVDQLAIVRSMTHGDVNHTSATHFLLTGQPPPATTERGAQWPHLGSVLSRLGRGQGSLPPCISRRPKLEGDGPRFGEESPGQFAGWLGPAFDPLTIDPDPSRDDYRVGELVLPPELSVGRLENRSQLMADLNRQLELQTPTAQARGASYRRAYELLTSTAAGRGAFNL